MIRMPNPTTKITPHELMTGDKPPPLFYGIPPHISPLGQAELDTKLIAFRRLKEKAEKRKSKARPHRNKWNPKIGDLLLVRDHKLSSMLKGRCYRMELLYKGPMVIEKFGNHTYKLENPGNNRVEGRFHKQMLRPYKNKEV